MCAGPHYSASASYGRQNLDVKGLLTEVAREDAERERRAEERREVAAEERRRAMERRKTIRRRERRRPSTVGGAHGAPALPEFRVPSAGNPRPIRARSALGAIEVRDLGRQSRMNRTGSMWDMMREVASSRSARKQFSRAKAASRRGQRRCAAHAAPDGAHHAEVRAAAGGEAHGAQVGCGGDPAPVV